MPAVVFPVTPLIVARLRDADGFTVDLRAMPAPPPPALTRGRRTYWLQSTEPLVYVEAPRRSALAAARDFVAARAVDGDISPRAARALLAVVAVVERTCGGPHRRRRA